MLVVLAALVIVFVSVVVPRTDWRRLGRAEGTTFAPVWYCGTEAEDDYDMVCPTPSPR